MKACITGGNGFLGRHIVDNLIIRKISTIQLCRQTNTHNNIYYDMETTTPRKNWFVGCSCLIHCAAKVHTQKNKSPDHHSDLYTNSTKKLIQVAISAGISHIIFMSSVSVYGKHSSSTPIHVNEPLNPNSQYGYTKVREEKLITKLCNQSGITYTIIRLPLIFGQNPPGNLSQLMLLSNTRIPLPFLNLNNQRSMVYIKNISDFVGYVVKSRPNSSSTILFTDNIQLSTSELVTLMRHNKGKRRNLFFLPAILLYTVFRALNKSKIYEQLYEDLIFISSDEIHAYGWNQPYSRKDAIRNTFPECK